jgi:hypothetical protein
MPRNPIDYSKTVFYKIVCKDITITDLYVGQTTDFKSRKRQHKNICDTEKDKGYNTPVYKFIRENGGFENWDMVMIHRQSCIDSLEAHTVERHYIETLGATLNCQIPSRSTKEWQETNKDVIKVKRAMYYQENKDRISAVSIIHYQANRDRIRGEQVIHYQANRDRIRGEQLIYAQNNRDKKKAYDASFREANKEAIRASKKLAYEKKKLLKQE